MSIIHCSCGWRGTRIYLRDGYCPDCDASLKEEIKVPIEEKLRLSTDRLRHMKPTKYAGQSFQSNLMRTRFRTKHNA